MPSVSAKQRRFMLAAAHSPSFARKAGISQSVAVEFNNADTMKKRSTKPGVAQLRAPNAQQRARLDAMRKITRRQTRRRNTAY